MFLDDAIKTHVGWKLRLTAFLQKPDDSVNEAEVRADDKCPLGQWIRGDGAKHKSLAEFSALQAEHARFHKAAAEVVKRARSGARVSAEVSLGSESEFSKASTAIVSAITALKRKV
ncbi:MAG: CZB domain-containing protein [Polyangiaceae bacterium]